MSIKQPSRWRFETQQLVFKSVGTICFFSRRRRRNAHGVLVLLAGSAIRRLSSGLSLYSVHNYDRQGNAAYDHCYDRCYQRDPGTKMRGELPLFLSVLPSDTFEERIGVRTAVRCG
jgi:hypothetical protein